MKKTIALLSLAILLSACGSSPRNVQTASDGSGPGATSGPSAPEASTALVLVRTDEGVAAADAQTGTVRWAADEAVSAPDGSAIFRTELDPNPTMLEGGRGRTHADGVPQRTRLLQIDPRTGDEQASWSLSGMRLLTIAAVAPNGRWIALTDRLWGQAPDPDRQVTNLLVFDPASGQTVTTLAFRGDVEPEAFTTDGQRLFALTYVGDHYRVQTIDLASGEQYDTLSRDKEPGEDMDGTAVQATLSADGTLLSTLYRNPGDADEPAFVHVLDLTNGWSHCADLAAPFGTGGVGSDLLTTTPEGTLLVSNDSGTVAEIDIEAMHNPDPQVAVGVTVRAEPGAAAVPDPVRHVPGFRQYISTLR